MRPTAAAAAAFLLSFLLLAAAGQAQREEMPWREAGLSERQAAAHLLRRFTYGPRPGDLGRVVEMGLGNWLEWQLQGDAPGAAAAAALARLATVSLTTREIAAVYPHHNMVVAEAVAAGVLRPGEYSGELGEERQLQAYRAVESFARSRGYRPQREILIELRAQKLYRALYSESQLTEVLTDFWFNHFNVSAGDPDCWPHVLPYERDAIRPRVLGTFRALLGATARHPAMLLYLDNAYSQAEPGVKTRFELEMEGLGSFSPTENPTFRRLLVRTLQWRPPGMVDARRERQGLNENYARELLELHTLGVDGGYGQDDVIAVARALTGWTLLPRSKRQRETFVRAAEETDFGFVVDGEFLFRADRHDAEAKAVLGVPLPAGRGVEDGEEVLDLAARHPATARHLAAKIAVRFVSDRPSGELVRRLARTFGLTGGDLREVIRELVRAREFWLAAREPGKLKSPFELVVSALRALDAEVREPAGAIHWVGAAGQPLYTCAAPTGYPDRPETWASAGSLLARVNFARALAQGWIQGVAVDRLGLVGDRLLGSVTEAIRAYLPLVLVARPLGDRLAELAVATDDAAAGDRPELPEPERLRRAELHAKSALAILLGSPEFQRR